MLRYLVLIFAVATAEVFYDGPCPEVKVVENFDLNAYKGSWYEIARYPYKGENGDKGKCTTAEYTVSGDKGKVKNSQVIDGVRSYIEGDLSLVRPAELMFTYNSEDKTKKAFLIQVLATDYQNYAISYNCQYFKDTNKHQVLSWIKSRSKTLEGAPKEFVDNFLKDSKLLESDKFIYNDHTEEHCRATITKEMTGLY